MAHPAMRMSSSRHSATSTRNLKDVTTSTTILIGVPYTPDEFVDAALQCEHPFGDQSISPTMARCLQFRMSTSARELAIYRGAALRHWRGRAAALAAREADLHRSMHPEVEEVMKSNRMLVFS